MTPRAHHFITYAILALVLVASNAEDSLPSKWCLFPEGYTFESGSLSACQSANDPFSSSTTSTLDLSPCNLSSPLSPSQVDCLSIFASLNCEASCPQSGVARLLSTTFCDAVASTSCSDFHNKPGCPLDVSASTSRFRTLLAMTCDNGTHPEATIIDVPAISSNISQILADVEFLLLKDHSPSSVDSPETSSTSSPSAAPSPSVLQNTNNDFCIFPYEYRVVDRFEEFCTNANHPIVEYPNGTLGITVESASNPLKALFVLASVVYCGNLEAPPARECIGLVFDTVCQGLCHRENVTRFPFGYDPGVFPKSRCDEIDLKCSYFLDKRCFFSPASKEMQAMKLGACEGGIYTFGAPANTDPDFPYVFSNRTRIIDILQRYIIQQGGVEVVGNLTVPSFSYVPKPAEIPAVFANRETSQLARRKPWWYFFVIILVVGLIIAAAIYAGLLYKKKFYDKPEIEELLLS